MAEPIVLTEAMLVSGIILAFTFIGIFTEHVHGFERAKFAMLGAGLMIVAGQHYGFYSPELAIACWPLTLGKITTPPEPTT